MAYKRVEKGERVSEYILSEKLGEGAFGEVWKAEHSQIPGKFVAIKFPRNAEAVELIRKEAIFQHELTHPNIVKTIGLNLDYDPPYFVMEFFDGVNLRRLINEEGILPPPYAIDIAVQILDALQYAHDKGVIHKDIKPENILVDKKKLELKDGRKALLYWVKITDLGLGKFPEMRQSDITKSDDSHTAGLRAISGTMFYMAPEQMNPNVTIDRRADIYSVGVVLYEMLTGELPLGMDLPSELNPVVPAELDRIVKRALSIDRDTRYRTCDEIKSELIKAKERLIQHLSAIRTKHDTEVALINNVSKEVQSLSPTASQTIKRSKIDRVKLIAFFARRRLESVAVVGAAVLMVVAFSVLLWAKLRPDRVAPPAVNGKTCALRVSTMPDGVEVFVDGIKIGVTPLKIEPLTFERHEITLRRRFYSDRILVLTPQDTPGRRVFKVSDRSKGGELPSIDCTTLGVLENLVLDRGKGHLIVETADMHGVNVHINGGHVGQTPLELPNYPAGLYEVELRMDGYKPYRMTVVLESGVKKETTVASLERVTDTVQTKSQTGTLRIEGEPSDALVFINDEPKGKVVELPFGRYRIRIQKKYYQTQELEHEIGQNRHDKITYALKRAMCTLTVGSTPDGAEVYLDGQLKGEAPLKLDVEQGPHKLRVAMKGFRDYVEEIDAFRETLEVKAALQARKPGTIHIKAAVPQGNIYVDHKFKGDKLPASVQVPPGKHKVIVLGVAETVELAEGGEVALDLTLERLGLVEVPAGEFWFGAWKPKPNEEKRRKVTTGAFYIDKYELSNERYGQFLEYIAQTNDHSRCHRDEPKDKSHTPSYWNNSDFNAPNQPVVSVDFYDAYAYAAWAGKRLPSEYEWEKAARGPEGLEFPWGNVWLPEYVNSGYFGAQYDGHKFTAPVEGFEKGRSYYGCYNMIGNVNEWTTDTYLKDHRIIKGGSYLDGEWRAFEREADLPDAKPLPRTGFRCVLDKP